MENQQLGNLAIWLIGKTVHSTEKQQICNLATLLVEKNSQQTTENTNVAQGNLAHGNSRQVAGHRLKAKQKVRY
jgi:hypothetical protein